MNRVSLVFIVQFWHCTVHQIPSTVKNTCWNRYTHFSWTRNGTEVVVVVRNGSGVGSNIDSDKATTQRARERRQSTDLAVNAADSPAAIGYPTADITTEQSPAHTKVKSSASRWALLSTGDPIGPPCLRPSSSSCHKRAWGPLMAAAVVAAAVWDMRRREGRSNCHR